jgi:Tfp pilus assembly protein PilF
MRTTLKYISTACASALLLACADLGKRPEPPAAGIRALQSANDAYLSGREHHLAGRMAAAEAAYWDALRADPTHVNARNGLATVHAERGDFVRAIPIWRALTENASMRSGPGAAFLFSNLGYAYFLSGDYRNAQTALEKACLLNPLNHRSWQHLGEALQKQGQDERAQQMFRQAVALREHDLRADYAATGAAPVVAAIEAAVKTTSRPELEWAATELRVAADGMLELRRIPAATTDAGAQAQAPAPVPVPAPALMPVPVAGDAAIALLEIRNGNGVTGMARALSRQMGDSGLKVTRLTNEKGFNVRRTRVEYGPAFRAAAERLAERVGSVQVVEVQNCKATDMRLVVGRDLVRRDFALRPLPRPAAEPSLAAASEPGKAG